MLYTILYIEDESAIVELVDLVLEHPDIRLLSAYSGAEGLVKAREIKPDLIILDVIMPGCSGWGIYEEIRADEALKGTPIIMLTAQLHRYRIMKEFATSAIDAYITKPFDVSVLRQEVEKMLDRLLWSYRLPVSMDTRGSLLGG